MTEDTGEFESPPGDISITREVWLAVALTVGLLVGVGLAGVFLRAEVVRITQAIYEQVGFGGIATILLFTETVVSPVPADAILLVLAGAGDLGDRWLMPIAFLGLISTGAGNLAWLLGRLLAGTGLVRRVLGRHHGKLVRLMRRHGVWAVILAALTPLPWSVAGWTAGALRMPWRRYFVGSLVRLPRTVVVFALIRLAFDGG